MTPDPDDADADGRAADDGGDDPPGTRSGADAETPFEDPPETDPDPDAGPFERVDADPAAEIEGDASEGSEAIVPKGRYCESCEHFDEPPAVRCTHEGAEIRELVDMEHFRVFDCPVVAARQEIAAVVSARADAAVDATVDGAGPED